MDIKVLKSDNSIEDFDENKIARVAEAAGLSSEKAKTMAANIAKWLEEIGAPQVKSLQIRSKVIEELQKTNQYAANLYIWYKKNEMRRMKA